MEKRVWTRTEIENLLTTNNRAVEKAMVAIYERQTADEKASETTNHNNNVGFSGNTARKGTYYAKWVLSGRRLTHHHLDKARQIALHHAGQLTKIANGEIL